jgi:hypothetical protein
MSRNPIEVVPNPRIDTLVVDAASGLQRRRTEYTGTVWFAGRPSLSGMTVSRLAQIESPFFLPDSLPYRTDLVGTALVACSVAIESAVDEDHQLARHGATLAPDPRDPAVSWVQLELVGRFKSPLAVSYRVDVIVPPEAVAPSGPGAG